MSDAPTLIGVATGAIALGAGALKFAQSVIHRNGYRKEKLVEAPTIGRLHPQALERMLEEAARLNTQERIAPILSELKELQKDQIKAFTSLNLVLVDLAATIRERS